MLYILYIPYILSSTSIGDSSRLQIGNREKGTFIMIRIININNIDKMHSTDNKEYRWRLGAVVNNSCYVSVTLWRLVESSVALLDVSESFA